MGVYLTSQFQWRGIENYSPEYCAEKLDRFFYMALHAVLTDAPVR